MESTWKSIGQVMFFRGVQEGEPMKGNPPFFNNPIVYVRPFYANSIQEINDSTKSRIIKIHDDGTYRFQPVDENIRLQSEEYIISRENMGLI